MGLREKLRERVDPFLRPGEQVEQAFLAQAGLSPWMNMLGALWVLLFAKPRIVAVTNQRIIVLRAGKWLGTKPKDIVAELPRQTPMGPLRGRLWGKTHIAGEEVWIHKRFHKDVEAADAALGGPTA